MQGSRPGASFEPHIRVLLSFFPKISVCSSEVLADRNWALAFPTGRNHDSPSLLGLKAWVQELRGWSDWLMPAPAHPVYTTASSHGFGASQKHSHHPWRQTQGSSLHLPCSFSTPHS